MPKSRKITDSTAYFDHVKALKDQAGRHWCSEEKNAGYLGHGCCLTWLTGSRSRNSLSCSFFPSLPQPCWPPWGKRTRFQLLILEPRGDKVQFCLCCWDTYFAYAAEMLLVALTAIRHERWPVCIFILPENMFTQTRADRSDLPLICLIQTSFGPGILQLQAAGASCFLVNKDTELRKGSLIYNHLQGSMQCHLCLAPSPIEVGPQNPLHGCEF